RDDYRLAGREMDRNCAGYLIAVADEIDHEEIAGLADAGCLVDDDAQRFRHRGSGVEEVYVGAARTVVTRREGLRDVAVLARPADAPRVHLAHHLRAVLAQKPRKPLVAQPAAG